MKYIIFSDSLPNSKWIDISLSSDESILSIARMN